MPDKPLVTIALPVLNGADTVEGVARRVLDQDYHNVELLISDNASTDGTEDVCRELARADSRVRYHRQPHNIGFGPKKYIENLQKKTDLTPTGPKSPNQVSPFETLGSDPAGTYTYDGTNHGNGFLATQVTVTRCPGDTDAITDDRSWRSETCCPSIVTDTVRVERRFAVSVAIVGRYS